MSDGLEATRQAIARAVERSDGSNDDRILRAVDPVLAQILSELPVGWEADPALTLDFSPETLATKLPGSSRRYSQQEQAAARAFRAATETIEGVTTMSDTEAVVTEAVVEAADPKEVEKQRQAPFVAKVVDRLGFMLANQQELQYLPQRDDGFIVDLGDGNGVRILAFYQSFDQYQYKALAQEQAKRLRHELSDWVYTGDRENIGEVVRCTRCGWLGSMTNSGIRAGALFTERCIKAPGVPGSLAGVKAHMDQAGRERFPDVTNEPPSTEWTREDDARR